MNWRRWRIPSLRSAVPPPVGQSVVHDVSVRDGDTLLDFLWSVPSSLIFPLFPTDETATLDERKEKPVERLPWPDLVDSVPAPFDVEKEEYAAGPFLLWSPRRVIPAQWDPWRHAGGSWASGLLKHLCRSTTAEAFAEVDVGYAPQRPHDPGGGTLDFETETTPSDRFFTRPGLLCRGLLRSPHC